MYLIIKAKFTVFLNIQFRNRPCFIGSSENEDTCHTIYIYIVTLLLNVYRPIKLSEGTEWAGKVAGVQYLKSTGWRRSHSTLASSVT